MNTKGERLSSVAARGLAKSTGKFLFISDAHLNDLDHERQSRLVSFLEQQTDIERLYIVGDLFDFWFGYRTVIFRFFIPILCCLHQMVRQGCELVYVLGNHDFHLGPLFSDTIPMRIIEHAGIEQIGTKRAYLIHGDGIDNSDRGYRILRSIVRSKPIQILFTWIHPDIGWRMARLLSHSSRRYTHWKKLDQEHAYRTFATTKITEGVDACIIGHSHFPFFVKYRCGDREARIINLGDWIDQLTYCRYCDVEGFTLFRHRPGEKDEKLEPEIIDLESWEHMPDYSANNQNR